MIVPIRIPSAVKLPNLAITALLLAACGGGNSGDDNNANDASVTLDAEVDAGPWTYDCPTDQPTDHVCIRGQVRDILLDEPVDVSAGSTMSMFVAKNKALIHLMWVDSGVLIPSFVQKQWNCFRRGCGICGQPFRAAVQGEVGKSVWRWSGDLHWT